MKINKNPNLYWFILGIFTTVFVLSIGYSFLFFKSSSPKVLGIKNKDVIPGAYQIEAKEQVSVYSRYKVKFIANTEKQPVNAVSLYVTFDPKKLKILNLNTTQSFCQFYPENKFDNNKGKISIACGSPNPGFTGKNTIAEVEFFTKNIGKSSIKILPKSQILLNDGKGTNIYRDPIEHEFIILNDI